jgi:hypothetical protein
MKAARYENIRNNFGPIWLKTIIFLQHIPFRILNTVTCTPEERRYLVTARQQLRKRALLGNG